MALGVHDRAWDGVWPVVSRGVGGGGGGGEGRRHAG